VEAETKWQLIRLSITAIALFGVWMLFTASLAPLSLTAGALGSLLIAGLTYDIFIARHQANLRFFVPRPFYLVIYSLVLLYHLYAASFRMAAAVLTGKTSPRIVHFRTRLRSDLARMVLANSITIAPGTITLDLNDDHLTVHWIFATTRHTKAAGEKVKGRLETHLQRVLL